MAPYAETSLAEISTGIKLEIAQMSQVKSDNATKLAICLHPWSWLGGNMHDPAVAHIARRLASNNFHVIFYNSRGVGQSTGRASLSGQSEVDDLKALTQWAIGRLPRIDTLVLVGYSYGSLIASLHPVLPSITTYHVLISYPMSSWSMGFLTMFKTSTFTSGLDNLIHNPDANVFFTYGDRDEFTSVSKYDAWVSEIRKETETIEGSPRGSARVEILRVPGEGHFWRNGGMGVLLDRLSRWLP